MGPHAASSLFITAQDGLRLHVRSHGPRTAVALPVVCLPGLARTVADFETLAAALACPVSDLPPPPAPVSGQPRVDVLRPRVNAPAPGKANGAGPRRVIALDSRGRGKSDYDRNPANYNLRVELADLLAVLTALAIDRAVFIGTSRGGILTMLLASARPTAVAGCVLNDIGPVIEPKGLMRIKSYVGKLPQPASFHEGADILRRLFAGQFPKLSDDDWVAFARRTFKEAGSRIVPDYDVRLARTLKDVNPERPLPSLWKEFDALVRTPMMVIRGGNSDILSAATVEAMRARRASLDVIEVPDEGHAPDLGAEIVGRIATFVANIR